MKIDIVKILSAFKTKLTANHVQQELAEKRLGICAGCEFVSKEIESPTVRCLSCGCLLHGKVFTQQYSECPENKWSEIDKPYFKINENKNLI
jgi:predicted Zn-ribbon and HTH transcriptional regulator